MSYGLDDGRVDIPGRHVVDGGAQHLARLVVSKLVTGTEWNLDLCGVRVPITGGAEQIVPLPSDLRLAPRVTLADNAIGQDGRIAVRVAPTETWFWPTAIFDPATGRVERVQGGDRADMVSAGWASDGRLVTLALRIQGSLWRFRPENEAR